MNISGGSRHGNNHVPNRHPQRDDGISRHGLQFDNADGTYNFNGTTTLNGGDAGVDIINGSGGTFTFASGTAITSPSGTAYREDTSTATVNYNGTIAKTNTATNAVDINAKTGGATTFSGAISATTGTANAIDLPTPVARSRSEAVWLLTPPRELGSTPPALVQPSTSATRTPATRRRPARWSTR